MGEICVQEQQHGAARVCAEVQVETWFYVYGKVNLVFEDSGKPPAVDEVLPIDFVSEFPRDVKCQISEEYGDDGSRPHVNEFFHLLFSGRLQGVTIDVHDRLGLFGNDGSDHNNQSENQAGVQITGNSRDEHR